MVVEVGIVVVGEMFVVVEIVVFIFSCFISYYLGFVLGVVVI